MKAFKLIRSLGYMLISSGFELAIAIAITIALAKFLSPHDLGILMAAEAFVELFNFFFRTGFRNSILKLSAQDPKGFEAGLNTAVANAILIKFIILIPAGFLIYFITHFSQSDPNLIAIIEIYILIYALESISSIFGIARKALGQFKLMSIIIATNKFLRLAVIFIVLVYLGGSLKLLVLAFLLEKIIRLLISAITTLRLLKPKLNLNLIKPMLQESFNYGLLDSLEGIQGRIDRVMINGLIGPAAVAFYSIPSKLNRASKLIPKAISQVFLPSLHETIVSDNQAFKSTSKNLSRFLAFAGILVFMFIYYYAEAILYKIFGDKYLDSIYIVKLFAFLNLIWFLEKSSELVLMSQAAHAKRFITQGSSIVTNIALNLVFIPMFGIVGAVYATIIANSLRLILYWFFSRDYIEIGKSIAIIIVPVIMVFFVPVYYLIVLFIVYMAVSKLVTKKDFEIIIASLRG